MYENGKIRPVETIPGMRGGKIKENHGVGWIKVWYIIRPFVNITMYPKNKNSTKI
jgi:hypothetical protein